jgi:hypothetical protein
MISRCIREEIINAIVLEILVSWCGSWTLILEFRDVIMWFMGADTLFYTPLHFGTKLIELYRIRRTIESSELSVYSQIDPVLLCKLLVLSIAFWTYGLMVQPLRLLVQHYNWIPPLRNVCSHKPLFVYQNYLKCFKKKKVDIRRTKNSCPLCLNTWCFNHPTAIPSPLSTEPTLNNPPLSDYYQYNHRRLSLWYSKSLWKICCELWAMEKIVI